MAGTLTFSREEWAALLTYLGLPGPFGASPDTAGSLGESEVAMGVRSLFGRGLLTPGAGETDDVHPAVAQALVGMLDAEEVVAVTVARAGVVTANSWYAIGDIGISAAHDIWGNLSVSLNGLSDVRQEARAGLTALRPSAPAAEQYPLPTGAISSALAQLADGTGESPSLALGSTSRSVHYVGNVRGWRQTADDEVTEETRIIVGLADHGTWVVDADGDAGVLTQLTTPWPSVLEVFRPR